MPRGGEPASDRAQVDPFRPLAAAQRERRDLRVCSNDLGIMVHGSRFTESTSPPLTRDRFGQPQINTDCRVSSVASITDDQLVEFYVGRGVVRPPNGHPAKSEVGQPRRARTERGIFRRRAGRGTVEKERGAQRAA